MTNATVETVWIFNPRSTVVQVHKLGCAAIARRNRHSVLITDADDQEDLREREFTIAVCKCAK
jgi:hypothetical protein